MTERLLAFTAGVSAGSKFQINAAGHDYARVHDNSRSAILYYRAVATRQ